MGYDILVPQCFFLDTKKISKETKYFFDKFPQLKINSEIFAANPKNLGSVQFIEVHNQNHKDLNKIVFANMFCNKGFKNKRKIDYILLAKCMYQIRGYLEVTKNTKDRNKINIWTNKFGSGFLGGNWNFIEQLMTDAWFPNNITVYSNEN